MTEFRVSRALERRGLSYKTQGLIYFRLVNISGESDKFRAEVRRLCREAAGYNADGLYKYLTDSSVNDTYMYVNYRIAVRQLYNMKYAVFMGLADFGRARPLYS